MYLHNQLQRKPQSSHEISPDAKSQQFCNSGMVMLPQMQLSQGNMEMVQFNIQQHPSDDVSQKAISINSLEGSMNARDLRSNAESMGGQVNNAISMMQIPAASQIASNVNPFRKADSVSSFGSKFLENDQRKRRDPMMLNSSLSSASSKPVEPHFTLLESRDSYSDNNLGQSPPRKVQIENLLGARNDQSSQDSFPSSQKRNQSTPSEHLS